MVCPGTAAWLMNGIKKNGLRQHKKINLNLLKGRDKDRLWKRKLMMGKQIQIEYYFPFVRFHNCSLILILLIIHAFLLPKHTHTDTHLPQSSPSVPTTFSYWTEQYFFKDKNDLDLGRLFENKDLFQQSIISLQYHCKNNIKMKAEGFLIPYTGQAL